MGAPNALSIAPGPGVAGQTPVSVRAAVALVVMVPALGLAGAVVLLWRAPFHWHYLAIFGVMFALASLGIGVGYHRLFTHRSFQTGPVLRLVWGILGSTAVEGRVIKWVAIHRQHHRHTDEPGDPHSPHQPHARGEGAGPGAVLRGAWHAHIGWFTDPDPPGLGRLVPDLAQDRVVRFVDRTFTVWVIASFLVPAAAGGILTSSWMGVLQGFLWGGLVRMLLIHHISWSVNSVCHLWGSRPFDTGDESRDNVVLGVLAFGEGWHNAHHAFPASARHGLAWWKLDVNYVVIRLMELVGLAWGVRRPSAGRIVALRRAAGGVPTPAALATPKR